MGSDRQSILIHENGKKHKENQELHMQNLRDAKAAQDRAAGDLQRSLAAMNSAAAQSHLLDVGQFGNAGFAQLAAAVSMPRADSEVSAATATTPAAAAAAAEKSGIKEWALRKKKRGEEKKRTEANDENYDEPVAKKAKRKQLGDNEGHYNHGDVIYLEGPTYVDLLEEDMNIQLWTGNTLANLAEKRLLDKYHHWIKAVIIQVRKSSKDPTGYVADVAYLKNTSDDEETIEKTVSPSRIRLELGSDERLPDTLEEARLAVVGEQVIAVKEDLTIDDNTGLSSWGTVEIRKTTARNEEKEDRDRQRMKRRDEQDRLEKEAKAAESRRMEEQKVDNAEDSALGAYDVWSSGKAGYKGVDINSDSKLNVADTAKSLSRGKGAVEFKKSSAFKKRKKTQNRRTTSADDD
jgi:WW domain-binding protein 4